MRKPDEVESEDQEKPHVGWEKTARIVAGFKDGDGDVPITNWLLKLPVGSIFLVMNKNNPEPLLSYKLVHKYSEAVLLQFDDHRGIGELWFEPELFIKKNNFIKVIIEGNGD